MENLRRAIMIKCPYCFETFGDDKVHFRSEYVNMGNDISLLKGYKSYSAFDMGYDGPDKEQIKKKYEESSFYNPGDDEKYTKFWSKFGGQTTEVDPSNDGRDTNKLVYRRKVIDPSDQQHQTHLVQQANGSYLIRNPELRNMVTSIRICDGDGSQTSRRVCPFCHNPLPDGYGLYPVVFISVIGIVGSGKTVFLSQFIKGFDEYAAKCGLTPLRRNTASTQFIQMNKVAVGKPLPLPTAHGRFEQPIIYNIEKASRNGRETLTVVMYDIAGEVFKDEYMADVQKFAPFVKQSNGIILLVDPRQFRGISEAMAANGKILSEEDTQSPGSALANIHSVLMGVDRKYDRPLAVCVSKMDSIKYFLNNNMNLINYISTDYEGELVEGSSWENKKIFNMRRHMYNNREMGNFIAMQDRPLMNELNTGFSNYRFFGFTALNCNVVDNKPVGPIQPHRIEEPILWMLNQIGFIGSNEWQCPRCHCSDVMTCPPRNVTYYRKEIKGKGIFAKKIDVPYTVTVNTYCNKCQYWFNNTNPVLY